MFAALLPPGRSKYHGKFINKEREVLTWEKIKEKYDELSAQYYAQIAA